MFPTILDHADYYRGREAAAREMARRASDPEIARIHLDLAKRYAGRIGAAGTIQIVAENC